jgi:hypothetical protein
MYWHSRSQLGVNKSNNCAKRAFGRRLLFDLQTTLKRTVRFGSKETTGVWQPYFVLLYNSFHGTTVKMAQQQ